MNPCTDCLYYKICFERRGICTEYKDLEGVKRDIEMLNKEARTAGCAQDGDEGGQKRQDAGVWGVHLRDTGPRVSDGSEDPADEKQLQGGGT